MNSTFVHGITLHTRPTITLTHLLVNSQSMIKHKASVASKTKTSMGFGNVGPSLR